MGSRAARLAAQVRYECNTAGRGEWEHQPVILVAEPPLQAEIMMSSSMMVSLMVGLPDWMMKTSFSRTLLRILTLVSPCREENMVSQVTLQQRFVAVRVAVAVAVAATADGALQTGRQAQGRLAPTLENCESSASAGGMPRLSHILLVRTGQDEPAKIRVLRMVSRGGRGEEGKLVRLGGKILQDRRSSS